MTSKGWANLHQDVQVLMEVDRKEQNMKFLMADKSNEGVTVERIMPFQQLPLEQGELVLDDYLCSIYELLYQEIKRQRG